MNKTILIGRLTKDPEMRKTGSNDISVTNFTLAVNRPFKNQQGEQEADFINCQTWRKQAENVSKYVKKGDRVAVEGRIQTRNFENDKGDRVFITEVVADNVQFLETKKSSSGGPIEYDKNAPYVDYSENAKNQEKKEDSYDDIDIQESELPF